MQTVSGEVFAQADPGAFDEEALTTIRQFFEDSLNVAETARHLYIHKEYAGVPSGQDSERPGAE